MKLCAPSALLSPFDPKKVTTISATIDDGDGKDLLPFVSGRVGLRGKRDDCVCSYFENECAWDGEQTFSVPFKCTVNGSWFRYLAYTVGIRSEQVGVHGDIRRG